jgi:hypothetical protein
LWGAGTSSIEAGPDELYQAAVEVANRRSGRDELGMRVVTAADRDGGSARPSGSGQACPNALG